MDVGDSGMLEWHEEFSFQGYPLDGESLSFWDDSNENVEAFLNLLDEKTPVKDCGDLGYEACNAQEKFTDCSESSLESSQGKRRRMLQFTSDRNKNGDSMMEGEPSEDLRFCFNVPGDHTALNYQGADQFSEDWFAEPSDGEMTSNLEEAGVPAAQDHRALSKMCISRPVSSRSGCVEPLQKVTKGKKILSRRLTLKQGSSVAYPFALIKPCGGHGGVTLNDINRRIQAPPLTRIKHYTEKDLVAEPTLSFSGKPVAAKTKIHAVGRKGSITIMRTRG